MWAIRQAVENNVLFCVIYVKQRELKARQSQIIKLLE